MSKFKVGDKVRIKKDLEVYHSYDDGCLFDLIMKKYRGKTAIVTSCSSTCCGNRYRLNIDDCCWSWSPSMLEKFEDKKHFKSLPRDFTGTIDVEKGFIIKKEILDDTEKEYLSAVIKPFKEKITGIVVKDFLISEYFLSINVKGNDAIIFPCFKKGTMYKNMKTNREYTLKELGLD